MVVRIRKTPRGKGREFSGPVVVQRPSGERAPGTGRTGEVGRVIARFSKCRMESEQRQRGCHTMKGLMATWKDWAVF